MVDRLQKQEHIKKLIQEKERAVGRKTAMAQQPTVLSLRCSRCGRADVDVVRVMACSHHVCEICFEDTVVDSFTVCIRESMPGDELRCEVCERVIKFDRKKVLGRSAMCILTLVSMSRFMRGMTKHREEMQEASDDRMRTVNETWKSMRARMDEALEQWKLSEILRANEEGVPMLRFNAGTGQFELLRPILRHRLTESDTEGLIQELCNLMNRDLHMNDSDEEVLPEPPYGLHSV